MKNLNKDNASSSNQSQEEEGKDSSKLKPKNKQIFEIMFNIFQKHRKRMLKQTKHNYSMK